MQTKITTKYNIPHPTKSASAKSAQSRKRKAPSDDGPSVSQPQGPGATLEVRAWNPDAGVVLKYETNKSWEVGRLFASLARLSRNMAALPELKEEPEIKEEVKDEVMSGTGTPVPAAGVAKSQPTVVVKQEPGTSGGGGGKKKKKGKR
jgi:hypothetical protein